MCIRDSLHADGTVAGFFCYPLDTLREEEGSQKIFDFRDKLEEVFTTRLSLIHICCGENARAVPVLGPSACPGRPADKKLPQPVVD